MATGNFLDIGDGIIKNNTCGCYLHQKPTCGYADYCSCAPLKGFTYWRQQGYSTRQHLALKVVGNAPCIRHDQVIPAVAPKTAALPNRLALILKPIEDANPDRVKELHRLGLRRESPYYYDRLKND